MKYVCLIYQDEVILQKMPNEAIQVAAKIPSAKFGGIEVRPLWGET